MDELRFSMYDIILKSINRWYGHAMGKLWKTIDAERQEDIKVHSGFHFVPPENFEDDWYIDVEGNAFANYKATSAMVHVREFGDDGLIYGERVFVNRYWVYSLLQFGLGYDYRGFSSKQEAYGYYKQQQEDPDYFDVVLYRIRASDRCDFIPMEFRYPVMEIMEKKYHNSLGYGQQRPRQRYQDFFLQYLHNLIYHNYVRCGEDEKTQWWGMLKDLEEIERVIRQEHLKWPFHMYELLDKTYDLMYDGGCNDIAFFK